MKSEINLTIGIPTFKRPHGLRKTLESIAKQSVTVSEVIVSDNAGVDGETSSIVAEFKDRIPSLRLSVQTSNLGAIGNLIWLLKEAKSTHFMWLADDDELLETNYLQVLRDRLIVDKDTMLVFPDVAIFFDRERSNWIKEPHRRVFSKCKTDADYLLAFCSYGGGHCFYGMYDREKLLSVRMEDLVDVDLSYFMEGRFLHTLFLEGRVRFEPSATMIYDGTSATRIPDAVLFGSFLTYSYRVHRMYFRSKLAWRLKIPALIRIARNHYPYLLQLWKGKRKAARIG